MLGKSIKIALGVAAGAALDSFAVSKTGQKTIKRIGEKTSDLTNSLQKDIRKVRKESSYFI